MKKILFVNGTYNDIPLVKAAHTLGLYVITSGNDPKGEAHAFGDEYCPCDYSDKDAMLTLAREKQIDYVCSCGNDLSALTAAYVAEALGLPGHDSYSVCRVFHEKHEFKRQAAELNLLTPRSVTFSSENEACAYLSGAEFPQIVKPVDLGGGKGISVAHNLKEGLASVSLAFQKSKNKHILIEDYIEGTQHGFICYIKDQRIVFDYSTNDYSYLNPYMVWAAIGYPADDYDTVRQRMIADVEALAQKLHVADGFLTIQYMMSRGKAWYIETMRRCLGNLHFKCVSRDLGVDLYELFIRTECGLDVSSVLSQIRPTGLKSGFMGIYADRNGVFEDLIIDPALEKRIFDRMMLCERGYQIDHYLEDKLGMVWFSFENDEERKHFIENRKDMFKVRLS